MSTFPLFFVLKPASSRRLSNSYINMGLAEHLLTQVTFTNFRKTHGMQIQPAENHTQTEQVNGETPSPVEPGEPRRFTKQRRFQQWFQTPSRIAEMRRYSFISQNKNCFQSQSEGVTNTKGKGVFAQRNHLSQVIQSVTFSSLSWRSLDTNFDSVTKTSQKGAPALQGAYLSIP